MRIATVMYLLMPAAAMAQAAMPPSHAGRVQRFLSPMGQPFRAPEGEPYPVAAWFAAADTDHDGKLTRAEFRADALAFFKVLDTNGDGVIDAEEIDHYELDVAPEVRSEGSLGVSSGGPGGLGGGGGHHGGRHGGGAGGGGGQSGGFDDGQAALGGEGDEVKPRVERYGERPMGGGRFGLLNIPEPVVGADTDLNRRITRKEFAESADRRFALLDPDDTGELTLATLPRTPVEGRKHR